ncbi:MAG: trypsin-like peptidase domain-containing protein [Melioribacteraceae bacterium]|nr:trypsin-like peptidase domain-containing protein [Melioribacteraceae bacterium]MCF8355194.1 trypsin-like peptidase domain-containing protein [Melioribacteraceae bacterium]MCF8396180.1 trypsin-like peptidase domain-containing protein [Melioribacteraceae bacterium]MCF8419887.1 trypsin-like peptidase domain-containing protein [Melioribacteraceae bacterium]
MQSKNIFGTIALLVIGVVFGATLVTGFGWVRPSYADIQIGSEKPPVEKVDVNAEAFNNAFVNVSENVTPSIVQIVVVSKVKSNPHEGFDFFFPFRENIPREQQGAGSGVIISEDGYILTNNHVVENATHVTVGLLDKREFDAEIIGTDPLTDLAVIKIDAEDLPASYLGDSDKIKVGQWVMAIGNPLSLASTVTAGIISATGRSLNLIRDDQGYGVENFIQTDAVINRGNSGGALVDLTGAVIGINSAIATDGMTNSYIGYGFAIPINLAKAVAKDLIAHGSVSRGYIGVQISEVNAATAKAVGLDKPRGVIIQNVVENGAAAEEDISEGDIILEINDKPVNQPNELQSYVARHRAGEEIKLLIFREGVSIERYIKLKARDDAKEAEPAGDESKKIEKKPGELETISFEDLGMTVKDLTDSEQEKFNVENGIIITEVKMYGKAYSQGLFKGLVITDADRNSINNVDDFEELVESKKGDAVLLKVVDANGSKRFVGLEIPN